jgi:excisionase family DNA binding protein
MLSPVRPEHEPPASPYRRPPGRPAGGGEDPRSGGVPAAEDGPAFRSVRLLPLEPLCIGERDAAKLLGLSERLLQRLRAEGRIPYAKLGGRVVFPLATLRAWVQQQAESVEAPAEPPHVDEDAV